MLEPLTQLTDGIKLTGDVRHDVPVFLVHHGCPKVAAHSGRVATEARRIAKLVGVDESLAELAGWLHDVSAVFPAQERASVARELGLEVLPEEDAFPLIIHQKLSVVLAHEIFGVESEPVLSAIGCHTTLKANATVLDKVLFVDVAVPTADASKSKVGDKAWVRAAIPGHTRKVEGKIIHISRVSDPATITNIVRIEVPNEKRYLRAGWHVTVYLHDSGDTSQAGVDKRDKEPN